MSAMIRGNALIAQGGGPTAVINQSLVGIVEGLRDASEIGKIFGARHGVRGIVDKQLIELQSIAQEQLERIAITPSAALGSTRDKPDPAYCTRILDTFRAHEIKYFFYIGGNDSSDTCRIVNQMARETGYELRSFHVPKTVDNDLEQSDHTPGYPSAARYVATAFLGDNLDNASIPGIKINVVMGRHAGFLTGAAAAWRTREGDGPHLVYIPERPCDLDTFVGDVERVYARLGRCQLAVSEGVQNKQGQSIGAALIKGETDAHGNVQLSGSGALGDALAEILKLRLSPEGGKPPRVRADTLGYAQRCWPDASAVDRREARAAGHLAATIARAGDTEGSIAIQRVSTTPYEPRLVRVPLEAVAAKTRHMPAEFIAGEGNDVTPAFIEWVRPLLGDMPVTGRL
jgi:6-phosphofructokinase 1